MIKHHPLNGICPYFTMFPLDFPERVLRNAKPEQIVVDPFCGRGTTLFAARGRFLPGYGIDTSPVAVAISRAKLVSAEIEDVLAVYDSLIGKVSKTTVPIGEFWQYAFHRKTLATLCALRQALIDVESPNEPAAVSILRGIALGALHGPLNKGDTPSSYFSNQMMRTFAPKPDYAVQFWRQRKMLPPYSDLRNIIKRRAIRLLNMLPLKVPGSFVHQSDARKEDSYRYLPGPIDWVITSPPYFGMRTYEEDQWLRLWFLGGPNRPVYGNSNQLLHKDPETFARDLATVWDRIAENASPNVRMVIRFGAISSRKVNFKAIIQNSLEYSEADWRLITARHAGHAGYGKRQSVAMGKRGQSNTVEECDFYARLVH